MNDAAVALAYKHCEWVTRSRARNFYYGIRLLPPKKRAAMCALYAMARRVDDIGDDATRPPAPARAAGAAADRSASSGDPLASVRASLGLLAKAAGGGPPVPPGDPVLMALSDAARHYPLPLDALSELVEGCEWDLAGKRYQTFDELVSYCRRVAGTVGRLSLAIFGCTDAGGADRGGADRTYAEDLADSLGVALQLTNILRDLAEDRDVYGRVYLPEEDTARFGVGPGLEGDEEDLMALVCFESGRAVEWYDRGLPLLGLLDRRSRACTAAMAGIYRHLLDRIRQEPSSVLQKHLSLSAGEKAAVAATALLRGAA